MQNTLAEHGPHLKFDKMKFTDFRLSMVLNSEQNAAVSD